jgi:hypothetical protein
MLTPGRSRVPEGNRREDEERGFRELREKLIRILGVPTVNRLIDRATTEIARVHPAMALLRCDGDEMSFDDVRRAFGDSSDADVRAGYTALNGVLLLLVARLLGREIALRLTEGVTVSDLLESRIIGEG